jgi:hypothetical protein
MERGNSGTEILNYRVTEDTQRADAELEVRNLELGGNTGEFLFRLWRLGFLNVELRKSGTEVEEARFRRRVLVYALCG